MFLIFRCIFRGGDELASVNWDVAGAFAEPPSELNVKTGSTSALRVSNCSSIIRFVYLVYLKRIANPPKAKILWAATQKVSDLKTPTR
jgi:hypothetical protein